MDANPELLPIGRIAEKIGLSEDHLDPYGCYTAKINRLPPADAPGNGKLILVTGITSTSARVGQAPRRYKQLRID
jgi:formate--tetrahydrofolate ligase